MTEGLEIEEMVEHFVSPRTPKLIRFHGKIITQFYFNSAYNRWIPEYRREIFKDMKFPDDLEEAAELSLSVYLIHKI